MKHKNLLLPVLVAVISFIAFDDMFSRIVRRLFHTSPFLQQVIHGFQT